MSAAIPLLAGAALPGPEPTRGARRRALEALEAAGWPTRRREPWRYTDLEPLAASGYALTAAPAGEDALADARAALDDPRLGPPSRRIVLVDGEHAAALGATGIDGIEVAALEPHRADLAAPSTEPLQASQYPLAALNTAFARGAVWIRVPAGRAVEEPIHVVLVGSARRSIVAQPRIVIEAEAGSRATFVQHFVDRDAAEARWTNTVTQIAQAAGSRLALYRLQRHGAGAAHTSLLAAELAEGAALTAGYFDFGGRLVRNDVSIALRGRDARTDFVGLLLAGPGQHVDDHTLIRHAAGSTASNENVRAIVGERGRGVFNGKVVVEKDCQRIDASQRNDNLLLGANAEIDTKPELEIYANDVKCSHGSTVGELDTEQLFYLRSRGLEAPEARQLLTTAFAAVIAEQIAAADVRAHVLDLVNARLGTLTER